MPHKSKRLFIYSPLFLLFQIVKSNMPTNLKVAVFAQKYNLEKAGHAMLPKDCDTSRTLCDLKVVCKSNHTKSSKYYQKHSINWLSSRIVHQQFAGYNFIRIIHSMKNV
jgi:hypothetical protein